MTVAAAFQKGVLAEPRHVSAGAGLALRPSRPGPAAARRAASCCSTTTSPGTPSAATRRRAPSSRSSMPPKGFSPALVHYIDEMGWKQTGWTAFTASIFDLGVKGLVQHRQRRQDARASPSPARSPPKSSPPARRCSSTTSASKGNVDGRQDQRPEAQHQARRVRLRHRDREPAGLFQEQHRLRRASAPLVAIACLGALVLIGTLDFVWLVVADRRRRRHRRSSPRRSIGLWNGAGFSPLRRRHLVAILGFNVVDQPRQLVHRPLVRHRPHRRHLDRHHQHRLRHPAARPHRAGPQGHGRDRGLQDVPRHRREEPAQLRRRAADDRHALRAHPALRHRARRRKALVRALRRRARAQRRPRRRRAPTTPSWYTRPQLVELLAAASATPSPPSPPA